MEEMKKILNEVLQELKWHSKQNEKIMDLLGKLKQPCGQKNMAQLLKIFDSMPPEAVKRNPALAGIMEQMKEVIKDL
jgi:flagellar motility protein MotE (MotC chaperone)